MTRTKLSTRLFEREGKQNLQGTIKTVNRAARDLGVRKVVVFTAEGDGPLQLRQLLSPECQIIAVTFPHEMTARNEAGERIAIGIPSRQRRLELESIGVIVVQGVMPFGVIPESGSDTLFGMRAALGTFGGGTQLCTQAVLMACDAGHLDSGERCIVMSADTAMIVRSGHSTDYFKNTTTFAIEHFLCKPQFYQISRGKREIAIAEYYQNRELIGADESGDGAEQKELPS